MFNIQEQNNTSNIFRVYMKIWTFWKNIEPHSFSISEVIYSEKRGYLNT